MFNNEKENKGGIRLVPPKESMGDGATKELLQFTRAFFDKNLQDDFADYIKDGAVKVAGRKSVKPDDPIKVDLIELTRHENPAIANVTATLGVYNPETITVETFEMMKKDPMISAGLAFIKLPITALPWRIECDNERIKHFLEHVMKRVWRKLIKSTLTAVDYGFASHEKVFTITNVTVKKVTKGGQKETYYDGRALIYRKFKAHYPGYIEVQLDDKENFIGVVQTGSHGDIALRKDKCFFFSHDEEFGNIFGRSRLVAAYKFWYWKEVLYQFMLMYFERRGSPPIIATAPPGESQTAGGVRTSNMKLALDLGASLLSNTIAAIPYEESKNGRENMWKVEYLSDDKRGEMFIQAINHLDAAILRSLWIPERVITQEGGGGGYSLASVHADLFLQSELGLINDVESAIDEQVLPILIDANFKPEEREPAYLKMDSLDWNRKIALKEIFIEMLRNMDNMVQVGLRPRVIPSLEALANILNVPVESFDEEVEEVEIPVAPGAAGQPPAANAAPGTQKMPPKVLPGGKAVPRRAKRESFPGSREVDRKTITPGGDRAEKIRAKAKLSDKVKAMAEGNGIDYVDIYMPQPDENGEIRLIDKIRFDLMKQATSSPEGLMAIKAALLRLKIWGGQDFIYEFELMSPEDIVRALRYMQDFHVQILYEAMDRKLSEDDHREILEMLGKAMEGEK